jgi:hypothetical protein
MEGLRSTGETFAYIGENPATLPPLAERFRSGAIQALDHERRGSIPESLWSFTRRRAAVDPVTGHMKSGRILERNRLKGTLGDAINALRSAPAMRPGI